MVRQEHWNLYWVESDGLEDCFIIAKNSQSACRIETQQNGFEIGFTKATKVMSIPEFTQIQYKKLDIYKQYGWPWYAFGKEFFENIGAEFRILGKQEEMLLEDVVYEIDAWEPLVTLSCYSVGSKGIKDFKRNNFTIEQYLYEQNDVVDASRMPLMSMLGKMS
ncbi:MAG: hypothetical protein ACOYK8_00820 [Alphaproteobacteria bacterium]